MLALACLVPGNVLAQGGTAPGAPPHVTIRWAERPSLRVGGLLRADVTGRIQTDAHRTGDAGGDGVFDLRRARVGVEGTIGRQGQFSIERELTADGAAAGDRVSRTTPWRDVWLEWEGARAFQVRGGRFKIPFGLDQLTGLGEQDFVRRSLGASHLSPGRDTGLAAHGRVASRRVEYAAGVFAHDGDNARSRTRAGAGTTGAARATAALLRGAAGAAALTLGGAVAIGTVDDAGPYPNGLRGQTLVTDVTVVDPVFVRGARRRFEADADWTKGPIGLRTEYTLALDERQQQGLGDETLPDVRATAWYAALTWVVTGQAKTRPMKKRAYGRFGVVEAAARVETLRFGSDGRDEPSRSPRAATILTAGAHAWTLGVNWSPRRFAIVQVNVVGEHLLDPERRPSGRRIVWSPLVRASLAL